jgi:hypothetical protein
MPLIYYFFFAIVELLRLKIMQKSFSIFSHCDFAQGACVPVVGVGLGRDKKQLFTRRDIDISLKVNKTG